MLRRTYPRNASIMLYRCPCRSYDRLPTKSRLSKCNFGSSSERQNNLLLSSRMTFLVVCFMYSEFTILQERGEANSKLIQATVCASQIRLIWLPYVMTLSCDTNFYRSPEITSVPSLDAQASHTFHTISCSHNFYESSFSQLHE